MRAVSARSGWSVRLHCWLGLWIGPFVLVSALTGTAMAWRDHVWRLQHPQLAGHAGTLDDLVYPLHSGRIAIPGWHLAVVLTGIMLALLAGTGFRTWLKGGRNRRRA